MDTRVSKRRALALLLLLDGLERRGKRPWVNPATAKRKEQGVFHRLMAELQLDRQRYHKYFRMSPQKMDELLAVIGAELTKQTTNFRAAVEPKQRLAVALRYLVTGDSFVSLAACYGLGHATVSNSVHMLCKAVEKMMDKYLPQPTEDMWRVIAQGFWDKWNFPNCLGAVEGKHVRMRAPASSGSQYYTRYKNVSSIVLLALVDAEHRFRHIQVGDFDRVNNCGVYVNSDLGRGMESGTFNIPDSAPLPGAAHLGELPYMMVGSKALPLKTYLMRPYPGQNLSHDKRIFNYRLSRARNVAENAFCILASRWQVLLRTMPLHPDNVVSVVVTCCVLHNFLLAPSENQRLLEELRRQRERLISVHNMGGNRGSKEAGRVREVLTGFFSSPEGSVPWQDKMV